MSFAEAQQRLETNGASLRNASKSTSVAASIPHIDALNAAIKDMTQEARDRLQSGEPLPYEIIKGNVEALAAKYDLDVSLFHIHKNEIVFQGKPFESATMATENIMPQLDRLVLLLTDLNCQLTSLNIVMNELGTEGGKVIAGALKHPNCRLTDLDLTMSRLGEGGGKAIAEALKDPNCRLTKMRLERNNLGPRGGQAIAEALKDPNCRLIMLDLFQNQLGEEEKQAFKEIAQQKNITIHL